MRRIDLLSGIFGCLIFLLSCSTSSSEMPSIHFISPQVDFIHDLNTDLEVEIEIIDDFMIAEYRFWLESASGLEYFAEQKEKINQSDYKLFYRFDLSNNISNDFSIHIEVIDSDGNKSHKEVEVSVF